MVMKKTDLGLFPIDWSVSDWSSVLDGFTSGATPSRAIKDYFKGNIRWITSGELNYNIIIDTIEHISKDAVKRTNLTVHPPGTFLMAITGLEAEGTRGSCGIIGKESTTNQSCLAIYGTSRLMIPYLFYFYVKYGDWLAKHYCQGTKQQSYTASLVKQLPIIYPPSIEEQRCITEVLSDVDNLISSLQKLIEKKKAIKQGAMQELLTGKKRLPGFSGEWKKYKVGEIGVVVTGSTPPRSNRNLWGGNFPWVSARDFIGKYISSSYEHVTSEGKNYCRILPAESVLVTCIASIGLNGIAAIPLATNQQINAIVCNNDFYNEIVYYSLVYNKEKLKLMAGQTAVPIISKQQFEEFEILLPRNVLEQKAIAKVLSDMDCEIEQLEKKLAKYQQIKQGMMQELLTGRIRLKEGENNA